MKDTYYSSLFSMFAKMAAAVSGAEKQKNNIIMTVISRVGTKFDIISAGNLYPGLPGLKKYSWLEDEGKGKPSV